MRSASAPATRSQSPTVPDNRPRRRAHQHLSLGPRLLPHRPHNLEAFTDTLNAQVLPRVYGERLMRRPVKAPPLPYPTAYAYPQWNQAGLTKKPEWLVNQRFADAANQAQHLHVNMAPLGNPSTLSERTDWITGRELDQVRQDPELRMRTSYWAGGYEVSPMYAWSDPGGERARVNPEAFLRTFHSGVDKLAAAVRADNASDAGRALSGLEAIGRAYRALNVGKLCQEARNLLPFGMRAGHVR